MVDYCAGCGRPVPLFPGLTGAMLGRRLRALGWIRMLSRPLDPREALRAALCVCPDCLAAPQPVLRSLLKSWGLGDVEAAGRGAFQGAEGARGPGRGSPPARTPTRAGAPRVRRCASCGRKLATAELWAVRIRDRLRRWPAKLATGELSDAHYYCSAWGCQRRAERAAARAARKPR